MWAQLITMRLKPEREADLPKVYEHLRAAEQPGSGLLRTIAMRDTSDPNQIYNFVIFESEEKARQREQDPRRQERLQAARALMGEFFDGPPTFVDFTVIEDTSY
jgi:quinol monooxygenase YgiN